MFKNKKGQGALEYLLLIGGAVLIAVIVIALLVGMGGQNKSNIETQNKKATDVLSAPVPPTITSVAVVSCSEGVDVGDPDTYEVRVNFTESVAESSNITYKSDLYTSSGTALLASNPGPVTTGINYTLSYIGTGINDCDTSDAYGIDITAEVTSAAGQKKAATSMKYNFVYP